MTHEEIAAITATDASAKFVSQFLEDRGARVLSSTHHGEYISAAWTVEGWENLLSTEFHVFEGDQAPILRALEYTVPEELESHVHAVLNVLEVGIRLLYAAHLTIENSFLRCIANPRDLLHIPKDFLRLMPVPSVILPPR